MDDDRIVTRRLGLALAGLTLVALVLVVLAIFMG